MNFNVSKTGTYKHIPYKYLNISTRFLISPAVISYTQCYFYWLNNPPFLVEVFVSFPFCIQMCKWIFKFFKAFVDHRNIRIIFGQCRNNTVLCLRSNLTCSKSPTIEDTKLLEIPLPCNLATINAHISWVESLLNPKSLLSGLILEELHSL